jgi:hypothetical protein
MNKIPVGRSIAHAYGFLFGRFLTVVSLSWVAALLYGAMRFVLFTAGPPPHPVASHWLAVLAHLGAVVAFLLLFSAIVVPLTRAALGRGGEWAFAYFVIGAREVRLFLAILRYYVIMVVVIALCVLGVIGVVMGAKAALAQWPAAGSGWPIEGIVHGLAVALAFATAIYVSLRLSFLLYAVAAVEDHASLRRSWSLGGGNVLRMFIVALAIAIPVCALVVGLDLAVMGPRFLDAVHGMFAGPRPDAGPLTALFQGHAATISVAGAIVLSVVAALAAGASAAAYRARTGTGAEEEAVEDVMIEETVLEPQAAAHHETERPAEDVSEHVAEPGPAGGVHEAATAGHGVQPHDMEAHDTVAEPDNGESEVAVPAHEDAETAEGRHADAPEPVAEREPDPENAEAALQSHDQQETHEAEGQDCATDAAPVANGRDGAEGENSPPEVHAAAEETAPSPPTGRPEDEPRVLVEG